MINLNILTDFCSYWWVWWILPFILGCLLMYSIMNKWRTMYEALISENRKQKNKIDKSDSVLDQHQREIKDLKGQMSIQKGRIRELESVLKNR